MPHFSPHRTRPFLTSTLLALGALAALSLATACTDDIVAPSGAPVRPPAAVPHALGLVEVTLSGIGTTGMTASVRPVVPGTLEPGTTAPGLHLSVSAVPGGDGSIQLEPLSTGSFTDGQRGAGGVRYMYATFRVRNAQADGTPYGTLRKNLTFLGVAGPGTLNATAISSMERFDSSSADPAIATAFLPTGGVTRNTATGAIEPTGAGVLQVLTEAEAGAVARPAGVTTVFPYGFVTRCAENCIDGRTLQENPAAGQFDGVVTFAFKVPLQASANDDPFTVSALFLAVDDDATRITESLEEQGTSSAITAADALGSAASITLLGNSTTTVSGHGLRRICRVRTAGTDAANPTATLVDASACAAGLVAIPSNVIVVDDDAGTGGDGQSWATAYSFLQDALTCVRTQTGAGQNCAGVDEIWVEQGIYYPDEGTGFTDNDVNAHFALVEGVRLYGGFAGDEYARSQRDWTAHPTVLDGNIDQDTSSTDNTRTILYAQATNSTVPAITRATIVDGFTIRNGRATSSATVPIACTASGAGTVCSPILRNLVVTANTGTAAVIAANDGGHAEPLLEGVTFSANGTELISNFSGALNMAAGDGGVVRPIIARTTFDGNVGGAGGAMLVVGDTGAQVDVLLDNVVFRNNTGRSIGAVDVDGPALVRFVNAEFWNNHAGNGATTAKGGALFLHDAAEAVLVNSTIAGNSATDTAGGIWLDFAHALYLENTIISGNSPGQVAFVIDTSGTIPTTITAVHSLIEGGCPADFATCTAVIDATPGFVDLAGGDLRLGGASPAVDAGENDILPSDLADLDGDGNFTELLPFDLAGHPRIFDWAGDDATATVDMGAYEQGP